MESDKAQLSFRKVLLSSGELTTEAAIRFKGHDFFESVPEGKTLGLKESQGLGSRYDGEYEFLFDNFDQELFDKELSQKSSSQISTAVSLAYMKARAYELGYDFNELYKFFSKEYGSSVNIPNIICNILNGGKHASNKLSFCEFMIIPQGLNSEENVKIASEIYLDLGKIIEKELGAENLYIGREGGFAPHLSSNRQAIALIDEAINKRNNGKCKIAIDIAANNFSVKDNNNFKYNVDGQRLSTNELVKYYYSIIKEYPNLIYLEDPFHEEDFEGWKILKNNIGDFIMIVADDLTITKVENIEKYINLFNACILKLNQAGTFSEFINSYNVCKNYGIKTIVSQRSGETDSNLISHIAVGLGSNYLKAGAPARERIVKYNELMRITSKY